MSTMSSSTPLTVAIEGDELVIRIGVSMLAVAVRHDPKLEVYAEDLDDFFFPEISDEATWAAEVRNALCREEEDGTTLVHLMLDKAANEAIEQGAEGITTAETLRDYARAHRDFPPESEVMPEGFEP